MSESNQEARDAAQARQDQAAQAAREAREARQVVQDAKTAQAQQRREQQDMQSDKLAREKIAEREAADAASDGSVSGNPLFEAHLDGDKTHLIFGRPYQRYAVIENVQAAVKALFPDLNLIVEPSPNGLGFVVKQG